MLGKPEDKALEEMVLHDTGAGNPTLLHKIIHSWGKFHAKGTKLGNKNCIENDPYRQWVLERVQMAMLPFSSELPARPA